MVTIGTLNGGNITITTGPATRAETRIWWSSDESNYNDYLIEGEIGQSSLEKYNKWWSSAYKVEIGSAVTRLQEAAFSDYINITSMVIPSSVTSIGNYAFTSCSGLANITLSDSITSIGSDAFNSCNGLRNVTITGSDLTKANNIKQMIIAAIADTDISDNITWNMPS